MRIVMFTSNKILEVQKRLILPDTKQEVMLSFVTSKTDYTFNLPNSEARALLNWLQSKLGNSQRGA